MAKRKTVTEQLKAAMLAAPANRNQISIATGISPAALSRFANGIRGLDGSSIDKLAAFLRLSLVPDGKATKPRRAKRPAR